MNTTRSKKKVKGRDSGRVSKPVRLARMRRLTDAELDEPVKLEVIEWEGRLHCAYLNDHRSFGGKPWGGGTTARKWDCSLRDVIRAFPPLWKSLGLDYLGNRRVVLKDPRK